MKSKADNLITTGDTDMTNNEITFKMFASFQYYENYGTSKNPHWKPKFGDDILLMDGITLSMLDSKDDLIDAIPSDMISKHSWSNSMSEQYLLGYYYVISTEPTEQEEMDAYFMGIDLDDEEVESIPIEDKYEQLAESMGY